MKRLFLLAVLTIAYSIGYGQKSIDALFDKYSEQDGFTVVRISGNLMKLAQCFDDDQDKDENFPGKISEIRILAQEDENLKVANFYDMIIKDIDVSSYEELMRVTESDQDLRILVRIEGEKFKEFLLIAGGEDNAVIQIRGDLTLKEAKKLSEDTCKNKGIEIFANRK